LQDPKRGSIFVRPSSFRRCYPQKNTGNQQTYCWKVWKTSKMSARKMCLTLW